MGLFDKLKQAVNPNESTREADPVIAQLTTLFGGQDNIVDMRSCAHTRVRIELAQPYSLADEALPAPFVAIHQIDAHLVHVIAQQDVSTLGLPGVR